MQCVAARHVGEPLRMARRLPGDQPPASFNLLSFIYEQGLRSLREVAAVSLKTIKSGR